MQEKLLQPNSSFIRVGSDTNIEKSVMFKHKINDHVSKLKSIPQTNTKTCSRFILKILTYLGTVMSVSSEQHLHSHKQLHVPVQMLGISPGKLRNC
jgi:hypothetical protein